MPHRSVNTPNDLVNFLIFKFLSKLWGILAQKVFQSLVSFDKMLVFAFVFSFDTQGFPGGSDAKESACNAGDASSIPGSGRCPGEGNGNAPQYSRLEKSTDRGDWQDTVHGVAKNQARLSN